MTKSISRRLLATALLLGACTTVRTEVAQGADFAALDRYAWEPLDAAEDAQAAGALEERVHRAAEPRLAELGMRSVSKDDAAVWIVPRLSVRTEVRHHDPYYTLNISDQVEDGTLEIDLVDPADLRVLWHGMTSRRLRTVARAVSVNAPKLVSTGEERAWPIEEMTRDILARFDRGATQ